MLESIYVGMTGLVGHSKGLRVISNNTANINTPGFKGSRLQFTDMFYTNSGYAQGNAGRSYGQTGYGLNTGNTMLNFKQGELRQTQNQLDLAVDGLGLFMLKDPDGATRFTRAGQFEFDINGTLVNRSDGAKVLGYGLNNQLGEISISGMKIANAKATSIIKFNGNISSTATTATVASVKVMDSVGAEHLLTLTLTNTNATLPGSWTLELVEGTTSIGTATLVFDDGRPTESSKKVSMSYSPTGLSSIPLTLDFGSDVTSFAAGNTSTIAVTSQDGYGFGNLTNAAFDETGVLNLAYSNGVVAKAARLALGRFDSIDAVEAIGNNAFKAKDIRAWNIGSAGDAGFGVVKSSMVEISNVDLSQEFSDLVVMQRGYQASSQLISTANEMLQELFSMKGR